MYKYKCKRRKTDSSDKSPKTVSKSGKDKRLGTKQHGSRPERPKPKVGNTGGGKPKPSDNSSEGIKSGSGCTCTGKVSSPAVPAVPGHVCCQGDPVSHLASPGHACQAGHVCAHQDADHSQAVGFQLPTVQPVLEAWIENVKKEMLQKQDLMLQMLRMEMLQARPPLGRGAYGLLPSF